MNDGPSFEANVWQYYQTTRPGQVQALGPDLFNGNAPSLTVFKNTIGATFPLLLDGSFGGGNENLYTIYGDRDSYCIINKQGVIRYQAYFRWPYANRYHLNELRGCIDSLVSATVDVPDLAGARTFALDAAPNPFHDLAAIDLTNPSAQPLDARVAVYDLAGRTVATLWNAPAPRGRTRIAWEGRGDDGSRVAPGVYMVRAQVGSVRLVRRVVLIP